MFDATPLLALYARHRLRRLRAQDYPSLQERLLLDLVDKAKHTRFGRDHGFADVRSVGHFRDRVPLRRYDNFWRAYWQPQFPRLMDCTWPGLVPYFAVSSGTTTGITKYIPCTEPMVASNIRAGLDLLVHHLANRPTSTVFGGFSFMLGGSTDTTQLAPGVRCGDISGILAARVPWYARGRYFPPPEIARISDWEEKIEAIARTALGTDIRTIAGTPSWLLILFDRLADLRPELGRRLAGFFPHLQLLVHGGVNFAPYLPMFKELLAGSGAETREVYPASEGFMAVADRAEGEGLRLMLDSGLFYEFVPVEELDRPRPTRHWIGTAEPGVNYAVVLSTCAGLWGYVVGDTVRFVDRDPPRILVTGRTSYTLSPFGEHVIAEELETAVAEAAAAVGRSVTDYSVGPLFPEKQGDVGRHLFVVEFSRGECGAADTDAFARVLDRSLAALNDDYRVHRERDYGMKGPRIHVVAPGTFARWMKSRGQLGGQHKVPRIINDETLLRQLRDFVGFD